jgi:hypothetical protein
MTKLLEFASEVALLSEDIPAHSSPVTIASANTVYAPDNLDIPEEPQRTPLTTFVEYIGQLPEWECDLIQGNSRSQIRSPPVTQPMSTH